MTRCAKQLKTAFDQGVEEGFKHGREEALKGLKEFVDSQAEDEVLWCLAHTVAEAYIQQELRKLHGFIEHLIDAEGK